jgi:hypothetical protein
LGAPLWNLCEKSLKILQDRTSQKNIPRKRISQASMGQFLPHFLKGSYASDTPNLNHRQKDQHLWFLTFHVSQTRSHVKKRHTRPHILEI